MNCIASENKNRRDEAKRRLATVLISIVLIMLVATGPAAAGEKFVWSEPFLSATITGSNEFYPGNNYEIEIVIENMAEDTNEILTLYPNLVPVTPSAALGTVVTLLPGDSTAVIKSGSYMVGDILKGESATVSYIIYIPEDAKAGNYNLSLVTDSDYLSYGYLITESEIKYDYGESLQVINIPVKIKGKIIPGIVSVDYENLDSGKQGYIGLTFKNDGYTYGKNAEAILTFPVGSPVTLEEGSVFIGNISPGETKTARFKAQVNESVNSGEYPADFIISYTDEYGNLAESDDVTAGISTGAGPKFEVVAEEISISPGETRKIIVTYKNTGDATAYDASSRITANDPFTAVSDSAMLGEIAPGETMTAEYTISLDRTAIIKPYGLNTEIKYYDKLDNLCLSDELKVKITAEDRFDIVSAITNPVVVAILMAAVLLGIYYIYRKESREHED